MYLKCGIEAFNHISRGNSYNQTYSNRQFTSKKQKRTQEFAHMSEHNVGNKDGQALSALI